MLEIVANLFNVDDEKLESAITTTSFLTEGTVCSTFLNAKQSMEARDSLASAIYRLLFKWIIQQINDKLGSNRLGADEYVSQIGLLDVAGFEDKSPRSLPCSRRTPLTNNKIKWDTIKLLCNTQYVDNIFSHDTWVFKSPMKYPIHINIHLGEMFCDSYLNYKLSKIPYKCYNLSKDINCLHIQEGDSTSDIASRDQSLIDQKSID